jgi:aminoglycoside phosphotransferase (APT) family kinase protein
LGESEDIDHASCAGQLGGFLAALHRPAPPAAPDNPSRGHPLADRDQATRNRLESLANVVDSTRLRVIWNDALAARPFTHPPVWLHGDLHPANLLFARGKVSGVLDFGDITSGDPATDLAIAWFLVPARHRDVFWRAYGDVDADLMLRAKGWALSLGIAYLAFSADNRTMGEIGEGALTAVLESA